MTHKRADRTPAANQTTVRARQTLAQREHQLCRQYRHAIRGTIRKEVEGVYKDKLTIEIQCRCGARRRVATSDLFQVHRCEDCSRKR